LFSIYRKNLFFKDVTDNNTFLFKGQYVPFVLQLILPDDYDNLGSDFFIDKHV